MSYLGLTSEPGDIPVVPAPPRAPLSDVPMPPPPTNGMMPRNQNSGNTPPHFLIDAEYDDLMARARNGVLGMGVANEEAHQPLFEMQKAVVHAQKAFNGKLNFHLVCQTEDESELPLA